MTQPAEDEAPAENEAPADAPLADALAAEHAAIYAYGVAGASLDEDLATLARQAEQLHRDRRDALLLLLVDRDLPAPPAAAAYDLPFPVADAEAALDLAVLVEERVAVVWRATLARVGRGDRRLALAGLIDAAVWATRWRAAAGIEPPTAAFPGES